MIFKSRSNLILNYCCYGPNYWSQTASLQPICMAHQMLSVPPVLICSSLIFGRMRIGHIEFECCGKFQSPKQRKYFLQVAKIRLLLYNVTLLCTCCFRFFFFFLRIHLLFQFITHILSHLSVGYLRISSNSTSKKLTMTFKIDQALIKQISNPVLSNMRQSPLSPT